MNGAGRRPRQDQERLPPISVFIMKHMTCPPRGCISIQRRYLDRNSKENDRRAVLLLQNQISEQELPISAKVVLR